MENIKKIKIKRINIVKNEDVYDLTIKNNHNFFANNILVHNCSEIPLSSHDSCRLGSLNLLSLVNNPFTEKAKFDWHKLIKVSRIAQRLMDDIAGLEEEKINVIIEKIKSDPEDPEIKRTELNLWNKILETLKKGRRTGIGLLGLSDAFAALGIQYGTKEASKLGEEIQKTITINCYKESVKLAKERGCFPIWNANLEAGNPFIRRVISDNFSNKEYEEYLKYGRRNIANIAIAPTGTIASEAQTASGIEPVFKIYYRRRRKINPNEDKNKVSYVDANGDSWEEYNVIHYPFIEWFRINSDNQLEFKDAKVFLQQLKEEELDKIIAKSPWNNSESHNIDYIEKINMLGAMQLWNDHSSSCTINLPEKTTIEEVNKIYFHGWKVGCKGLTIYRDGSRSGVLLTTKKDEVDEFKETNAPKRPKTLEADYYIAKADGKEFAVIIGLWKNTNKPYEIFAFENPPASKNTRGRIVKEKKGHYKFINGEFEIENLQLASGRKEERTLTLTASMLLRHGAGINHVNNVIKKIDDNITSFSSVVRRCLSKYIIEEISGEACPECGGKLVRNDGCIHCEKCEYSKCS